MDQGRNRKFSLEFLLLLCFVIILSFIWYANVKYSEKPLASTELLKGFQEPPKDGTAIHISGVIKRISSNKDDIIYLNMETDWGLSLDVVSFPGMGILPPIRTGDLLDVTGVASHYKNKLQIQPLSKESIKVIGYKIVDTDRKTVSLDELKNMLQKKVTVGPVTITNLKKVKSKSGKENLQFIMVQNETAVNGIMFEGEWTEDEYSLLRKGKMLFITGNVTEFNKSLSLTTTKVEE